MMAQAKRTKPSWMSSRISDRMRSRRNQCSRAKPCSTTQRYTPSPESCCSPRRAMTAIGVERIRTLGAGCASAGSHAGGQVAQGRGGHIDAGRVDKDAEAPGRTGDLGREPVYQEGTRPDTDPHLNHPPPHTGWKRLTDGDSATSVNPVFRSTRTISCLVACTAIVYTLLIRRITGLPGPSRAGGGRIGGTPTRWRL